MNEKYFSISDSTDSIECKLYADKNHGLGRIILCCHGFLGNKENRSVYKIADYFTGHYKDIGVLCFDWPCHGKDVKQKLSLADCDRYYEKVVSYIKDEMGVGEVYLQATSFGGYMSLKYLHEHDNPFKKIALRCPAVNMLDILCNKVFDESQLEEMKKGKTVLAGGPEQKKLKITWDFLDELSQNDITEYDFLDIAEDTIVIQGNDDSLIDPDFISDFCENNVIECYRMDGTNHTFSDHTKMMKAIDYMKDWFNL